MYKFPENPVLGQEYTEGQKAWKWNGVAWNLTAIANTQVEIAKEAALAASASLNAATQAANTSIGAASTALNHANAAAASAQVALQAIDDVVAAVPTDNSQLSNGAGYVTAVTAPVRSVAGKTGAVILNKGDVQLGNVDNTSDINKPVSNATQAALLDVYTSIPTKTKQLTNDAGFITEAGAPVRSVSGKFGDVTLNKGDVQLGNVNNTSDADKPVSTAQATAINAKEPAIPTGAAGDYWTGAKTFAPLGAAVLSTTLVGYTVQDVNTSAADSVLTAIGKIQGQVNAREVAWKKNASNGYAGLNATRQLQLPNAAGNILSVLGNNNSAYRVYSLPDKTGTVALLEDIAGSLRNRIINGACLINQRGSVTVPVTQTSSAGYGGPDHYSFLSANGAALGLTVATGSLVFNGQTKSTIRQTVSTPATTLTGNAIVGGIGQAIEGINCFDLYRKPMALSFIFNTTVAGTYNVSLRDTAGAYSYVASFVAVANTPMKVQVLIPACPVGMSIPATSAAGLALNIGAQNTGMYQAGTLNAWTATNTLTSSGAVAWASVANAYIEATEIQLEEGSAVTAFEQRPYSLELMLCQRYHEVSRVHILAHASGAGAVLSARNYYRVTKRAIPTLAVNLLSSTGLNVPATPAHSTVDGVTLYATATGAANLVEFVADITSTSEL